MEPYTGKKREKYSLWSIILVFIVGFGLGILSQSYQTSGSSDLQKFSADEIIKDQSMADTETPLLIVNNQFPGPVVEIAFIRIATTSWVAIHEDDDGAPARILGAQLFSPGTETGTVTLLRYTEPGRRYHAFIHHDDGDRVFDYTADLPIGETGNNTTGVLFQTHFSEIPIRNESAE